MRRAPSLPRAAAARPVPHPVRAVPPVTAPGAPRPPATATPWRRALLTARTARHLTARQIAWRLHYRLRPRPAVRPGPAAAPRRLTGPLSGPAPAGLLAPGPAFTFLGRTVRFAGRVDWTGPGRSRLWDYNLHYFDYLGDAAAFGGEVSPPELVRDWIRHNAPGSAGWEPYPTSLRIVNWTRWALAETIDDPEVLGSLSTQLRWLERHLEHHIAANHLFANAKALLYAGLAFGGADGERWLARGAALLERELDEQVLPDGGHYERSPMYHAILVADLLDLIELGAASPALGPSGTDRSSGPDRWRSLVARMVRWLATMTHPDGGPAFFNDAALGIAPPLSALAARAAALGVELPDGAGDAAPEPSAFLAPSGYVRLAAGPAALWFDAAPVGPDHQPGHTHADTLSIELSVDGRRVLVNSGTSTYAEGEERRFERSTAAHNTVEIDGEDSSEVWAAFRVARRARPRDVRVELDRGRASAAHDGYLRLPGRVTHARAVELDARRLRVVDTLGGEWRSALARYHFHPDFEPVADRPDGGRVLEGGRVRFRWRATGATARVERTRWRPRFGKAVDNRCLVLDLEGATGSFELEAADS